MYEGLLAVAEVEDPLTQAELLLEASEISRRWHLEGTPAARDVLRQIEESAEKHAKAAAVEAPESDEERTSLAFFWEAGCAGCSDAYRLIGKLVADVRNVDVREFDLESKEGANLNRALADLTHTPKNKRELVPAVFSARKGLVGEEITLQALKELAESARGMPAPWELVEKQGAKWPMVPLLIGVLVGALLSLTSQRLATICRKHVAGVKSSVEGQDAHSRAEKELHSPRGR
jgi:hypothetical protein